MFCTGFSHTKRLSASVPSVETCIRYSEKVMPSFSNQVLTTANTGLSRSSSSFLIARHSRGSDIHSEMARVWRKEPLLSKPVVCRLSSHYFGAMSGSSLWKMASGTGIIVQSILQNKENFTKAIESMALFCKRFQNWINAHILITFIIKSTNERNFLSIESL